MTIPDSERWLRAAQAGEISWSQLAENLLRLDQNFGEAHHPDLDRPRRCGFGEVIYGEGKTAADIRTIANKILATGQIEVLVTRVDRGALTEICRGFPHCRFDSLGRTLRLAKNPIIDPHPSSMPQSDAAAPLPCPARPPQIAVVTAGSTDLPVAREALETLGWMQVPSLLIRDVGVAGPYRIVPHLELLRHAAAIVVVAGMEGALASVVGGLVPCPVVAVPTSVGYGANLGGVTTMLSMLSSCAAGVTTVNIDGGFKGGYVAGLIANRVNQSTRPQGVDSDS